jgi:hypothetical protein
VLFDIPLKIFPLGFSRNNPTEFGGALFRQEPQGAFVPMLRMYWPKAKPPSIIAGKWKVPVVEKLNETKLASGPLSAVDCDTRLLCVCRSILFPD